MGSLKHSSSVLVRHQISAPYSILHRAMEVYSHRAVIRWTHPNLVPARLTAKMEDRSRLMCCKDLLSVEGKVDL